MKSKMKENVQDFHFQEYHTLKKKLCNSTLLAKVGSNKKPIFKVRCLSENNLSGSQARWVRLLSTKVMFHSSGLTSVGGHVFSKLLNILLPSLPVKEKTWIRAAQ